MKEVLRYLKENQEVHMQQLYEFLKIPSISSLSEYKPDMERCAEWLKNHMIDCGIENTRIIETPGHSIVYGEWLEAGKDAPTVLIYGHYDVQPVDPLDLWTTPPFEPEIRNGKIYGRGTADDKGQLFSHVKALEAIMKIKGKLPVNVKLLFEGEEEAGSSNLDKFIEDNAEMLACDTIMISDTEWFAEDLPSLCYALRGISYVEIKVTGPNRDVHSGTFGGAIDNPLNVLCWMVSKLHDKYGRIAVPGFYDDVLELSEEEREGFKELPYNEKEYCRDLGIENVNGEIGYSTLERAWARPSLDVNGIFGGFMGEGAKTVITSHGSAKISMRLVPHQDPADITKKIGDYLKSIAPPTVKLEFIEHHSGKPVLVERDSKSIKVAIDALKEAFGQDVVFMREGGSIAITEVFQSVLKAPSVLMGFGLPSDNIHSPDESYGVENYYGGIRASALFLDKFSKQ